MGTLDDNVRVGTRDDAFRIEARRLSAEIERLRAEWRKADDGWIAAKAEADALRAAEAETASVLRELNVEIDGLRAEVRELRASGRETLLETTRRGLREFGTPPPGEGTHPLQGHRDSMG